MKKNFIYALMSAIALTGAASFSACSSSDEVVENNPNFDPETNKVKTEFVINVTQPGERTRMATAAAGAGAFQGLNDMYLLCFPSTPGTSTAIAAGHELSLAGYPSASLNGTTPTQTDNSSKWYTLYIPTTTSNFLFYAKTVSGTPAAPATTGKLNYTVSGQTSVGNISFSLSPIASTMIDDETTLLGYLNAIVAAKDGTDASKTWESTVAKRDGEGSTPADPHYKALADAYQQFISTSASGVRQGSARAILSTITDLFASVNAVSNTETGDPKLIADAVLAAIGENFTIDGTTGEASFKNTTLPATTTAYPQNLPDGSAILKFNSTSTPKAFEYTNGGTIGTATIATAMNKFTYPSELTYYCNSALRATSSNVTTSTLPTTSVAWLTEGNWTGWTQTAVDASTRAVAMKENITYGAAQLYSTISSTVSTFTDNAYNVTHNDNITGNDKDNQSIDLSGASDYLKVTGIIIGGQPNTAGFDYLPSSTSIDYAIYDKVDAAGSAAGTLIVGNGTTSTATYYTLALDNYTTAASQSTVNIAVEFVASKDFFGKDGLIKAGQSFYLIGALDPTSPAAGAIDWTNHVSFKSTDTGYNKDRVFIRDAKTTATFTLNATSLQNAYSTIPDLRSTQMVFGLSVDLAWKPGLTFNVSF